MAHYIDAEKLKMFEEMLADIIVSSQGLCTYEACKDRAKIEAPVLIDSLQEEQLVKSELKEEKIECSPVIKEFIDKFLEVGRAYNFGFGPKDFLQEQTESSNGKFVFPNFLYARTIDNKTIDVSYVPQSMDAVEYIKNDPTEQPEVNLEEEIDRMWNPRFNLGWDDNSLLSINHKSFEAIARHFFNLGLNTRKI